MRSSRNIRKGSGVSRGSPTSSSSPILIGQSERALTEQPLSDGEAHHGIFATRHFNRPNPIGISYVALNRVIDGTLHVRGIDLLDGTPVLDIKPYVPAFDSIPHAVTGWVSARHIERIRETSIRAQQEIMQKPAAPVTAG